MCVFLSYINDYSARAPIIEALLDDARRGELAILTSAISIVEVSFAAVEQRRRRLLPDEERRIDALWLPPSPVRLVEYYPALGYDARALIREAIARGRALKPMDAIHLSTARRQRVVEFCTYDTRLHSFAPHLGFAVREPSAGPYPPGRPR